MTRELTDLLKFLPEPQGLYAFTIALVCGFSFLLFCLIKFRQSHGNITPFETDGGRVEIASKTLKTGIERAVAAHPAVKKVSSKHKLKGFRLAVNLKLQLRTGSRLKEVEAELKELIRTTLQEQFGIAEVEPINLQITRIVGKAPPGTPTLPEDKGSEAPDVPE